MVKLKDLLSLQKDIVLDLNACTVLQQETDLDKGVIRYVLQKDEQYYYGQDFGDHRIISQEIVVDWTPFPHRVIYAYTPDAHHIYQVETGLDSLVFSYCPLALSDIEPGMQCSYDGHTLEYVNSSHLKFDGRILPVENSTEFTYQILKTKLRGIDGAKGIFRFFDSIAEEGKHTVPFWYCRWNRIFEFYQNK